MLAKYLIPVGTRYARWITIGPPQTIGEEHFVECKCDCGTIKLIRIYNLLIGRSSSCGCINAERIGKLRLTHGHSSGGKRTPEHATWLAVVGRCNYPTHGCYPEYGGRGIKICAGWGMFEAFFADMGKKPRGHSIDRIDNGGNYSCGKCEQCIANGWPMNCRWASLLVQANNKRNNRVFTVFGKTDTLANLCREFGNGLKWDTVWARLEHGWAIDKALSTPAVPLRSYGKPKTLAQPNLL